MRYLDSGRRDADHTLASWLAEQVQGDISALRLQTGFFSIEGIGLLTPVLESLKKLNRPTSILIGSNDASTLRSDVTGLATVIGIPRGNAKLGVVNYDGAFFHPKTYHFTRTDGSQSAFVGSANLTKSGLTLHVEAGISLDTNEGDDPKHLSEIALAIDAWFDEKRPGLTTIAGIQTIDALVASGVLSLARPQLQTKTNGATGNPAMPTRPRLLSLFTLPPAPAPAPGPAPAPAPASASTSTSTPALSKPLATQLAALANSGSFWIEAGALTSGSRNQLDLSVISKNNLIAGSMSLFGLNGIATSIVHNLTIRYQGIDYANNKVVYPMASNGKTNGTWRFQMNGTQPNGQKLTVMCPGFVDNILVFTPLGPNHFEISLVSPQANLPTFLANSTVWDRSGKSGGKHIGKL